MTSSSYYEYFVFTSSSKIISIEGFDDQQCVLVEILINLGTQSHVTIQ